MASALTSALAAAVFVASSSVLAAQVLPDKPVSSGAVDGAIPALPASSGILADAPAWFSSPLVVHEGRFTWGLDLTTLTNVNCGDTAASAGCSGTWRNSAMVPHTASAALSTHLSNALLSAFAHQGALEDNALMDAFDLFKDFAKFGAPIGDIQLSSANSTPMLGYKPLRARWLHSQWGPKQKILFKAEKQSVYPDYFGFQEIRLRGARTYCAAREAHFQQNGTASSLGEYVGFTVDVLGHTIEFMVAEGRVRLAGPERFLGPGVQDASLSDGAQAFAMPFLFGTRVTPVRGVGLPGFGEVRIPVALVTGDSEVKTASDKRNVLVGWEYVCSRQGCDKLPKLVNMHSKEYRTVTHVDAILSASRSISASKEFTLFFVGPIRIVMDLGLGFTAGAFAPSNDRVLDTVTLPLFPPTPREGRLFQNLFGPGVRYHDGAWAFASGARLFGGGPAPFTWVVLPDGATDPFWRSKIHWFLQPHDIRATTDDDHVVTSTTKFSLDKAELDGVLGGEWGPFDVKLTVGGGLSGYVSYQHRLSDALMAQDPGDGSSGTMRPITALTLRPRQEAAVSFTGLHATLHFELDLGWFGTIDFDKQLFNVGAATLADYDSDDGLTTTSEQQFLRVGTGSKDGSPMKQPDVLSHLPSGPEFSSFPVDVAACLADEKPNDPTGDSCPPEEDGADPPRSELCIYGPDWTPWLPALPANVCADIPGYAATVPGTPEQKECASALIAFLCQAVSKEQAFSGANVVARVWNLDVAMNYELKGILEQCATAFYLPEYDNPNWFAKEYLPGLIGVSACTSDATLIPGSELIQPGNPFTPPAPKPGKCS